MILQGMVAVCFVWKAPDDITNTAAANVISNATAGFDK